MKNHMCFLHESRFFDSQNPQIAACKAEHHAHGSQQITSLHKAVQSKNWNSENGSEMIQTQRKEHEWVLCMKPESHMRNARMH